ncbi:hypothetical protein CW304_12505 [Bacillus sp. UFRGS-B20]|nr:hypothetical protein CW304_12505 [Bacillus sp. UFRGS-B20]
MISIINALLTVPNRKMFPPLPNTNKITIRKTRANAKLGSFLSQSNIFASASRASFFVLNPHALLF